MEGLKFLETLLDKMTIDELRYANLCVQRRLAEARSAELFLANRFQPAWTSDARTELVKCPPHKPVVVAIAPPVVSQRKTNVLLKDDESGKEYFYVCSDPQCECRYYLRAGESVDSIKVDPEALFVRGFDPNLDYETSRRRLSTLIRLCCVRLYRDAALTYESPFEIDQDEVLTDVCEDALDDGEDSVRYKGHTLYIRVRDAPLPKSTYVKTGNTYGSCRFVSHKTACRAMRILESMGYGCTFLVVKK